MGNGTCVVVFDNGIACWRSKDGLSQWCVLCRAWSRSHAGADPDGRKFTRTRGTLLADIRALSQRDTDGCVVLPGYNTRPKVALNGKQVSASRAAWILEHGDPGELWVLHTCHQGEEGCVSLRHLYLGTHENNTRDMTEAGRAATPGGKLTPSQVHEIRRRYVKGNSWHPGNRIALAEEFGVRERTIRDVVGRKSWGAV